jgi:hypothetical protein
MPSEMAFRRILISLQAPNEATAYDQNGSGGSAAADGLGCTGGATALVKNGAGTLLLNGTNTS